MRILLVIHEKFNPDSGSAGSTFRLGEQYRKQGHEVFFFSMDDMPKVGEHLKRIVFPEIVAAHIAKLCCHDPLDVVDCSPGDMWFWAKVTRIFRKHRPLLVTRSHGLHLLEHLWLLEEARQGNLKLSWIYPLYRGGFQLWEIRSSIEDADRVFLLNREEQDYVVKELGVSPERTHVFPNGIPNTFLSLPFDPLPVDSNLTIRIAQISTYIPRKGIQYASPALQAILKRYPNVEVSFLGTACTALAEAKKAVYADFDSELHHRIQVVPYFKHETLPELLKGHHIKLLPTLSEGFGKALVEAMACGLAPVTSNAAGPMEIVQDQHDALVVPMRDSLAIERALERLITDLPFLETLRRNAYATAQNYSWQRIADDRLTCYKEAIEKKAAVNLCSP
ncbi:MAG: glycosyltransferase family 4 protein [Drouetiella hepatica Uher 2000/2452]|jgi:glycosyltransferase involved in cell wall biosynthesis|uniref:Glycosyltransferase family 4 protein n=1 Tax=Drouetiella hepatica Uher 2000/2452 TaxID=904376 RepID=A0A951Q9S6_9CYAN|nr:glycosyltransferase family 4 protein [Drouetiella hepatica Uher 2000/2452]